MKVIVPIGGGEISLRSTIEIDKYIVSLVDKETKKVLFIPTASGDMPSYIERFTNLYKELGCEVDTLLLSKTENDNLIRSKIFSSDIIYIGGGNTARMMRIFKRTHVNEYLKLAYEKGIILTGLSAGAMAYFTNGYSDSNRSTNPEASLCLVKCLDLIPYCFCPHYNEEERKSFDEFVVKKGFNGLALEDNVALVVIDDKIQGIIKSNTNNTGYYIINGEKEEINDANTR
jgi:dipeptidase E